MISRYFKKDIDMSFILLTYFFTWVPFFVLSICIWTYTTLHTLCCVDRHGKNKIRIKYILLARAFYPLVQVAWTLKTISWIPVKYSIPISLVLPFKIHYKCQFYFHQETSLRHHYDTSIRGFCNSVRIRKLWQWLHRKDLCHLILVDNI